MVGVDASSTGVGGGIRIDVPEPSVVALVGPSGSGKSSFARRHFWEAEIFSSDAWRARLSGREANQAISAEAFAALYAAAAERLAAGCTVVIDATNLALEARGQALDVAWRAGCSSLAVAFDLPLDVCLAWNRARVDRQVTPSVVRSQHRFFQRSLRSLGGEGFDALHVIRGVPQLSSVRVERLGRAGGKPGVHA